MLVISGCGYKDIDKRFFVVTVGIGQAEGNKLKVVLKLAIPAAEIAAGQEEFIVLKAEAETIAEAVQLIKAQSDKELDFGHAKAIILGESIVQSDKVYRFLDWFERRRDIQRIAFMAVGKPGAEEVMKLKPKFERIPSNAIFIAFGLSGTESEYIVTSYHFDFFAKLHEMGIDPVLPVIEAKEENFDISTSIVMSKEKGALRLNPEETEYYKMMESKSSKVNFHVRVDDPKLVIVADSVEASYRLIVDEPSQRPKIEMNIKMNAIEQAWFLNRTWT